MPHSTMVHTTLSGGMSHTTMAHTTMPNATDRVIRVAGPLTSATADALRDRSELAAEEVLIDVSQVSDLDHSGVGALFGAIRTVREHGGTVVLEVGPDLQQRLLGRGVGRLARVRVARRTPAQPW
ncbi:MAG: STAS domain-containing protein [Acidimicrobiia bacterium]